MKNEIFECAAYHALHSLTLTLTLTLIPLHAGNYFSTLYLVSATLTPKKTPQPLVLGISAGEILFSIRVAPPAVMFYMHAQLV